MKEDKVKGALWGLVVGDCLGSPIQFTDRDDHPWITEMESCPGFCLPPGYWTDDSSMAMCVMESFTRLGRYDLKDIANNFTRWYYDGFMSSTGYSFDVGYATEVACQNIREKGTLENGREESQGNGSIMRFAPSYFIARALKRPEVIDEVSDLTHASERVRGVCNKFRVILDEHLSGQQCKAISEYGRREEVNNSGWAVSTLEAAIWAFKTTNSFEEGMITAVNLGGDSDSIGAVYGQLAGVYYGFSAIPDRWVKAVHDYKVVNELIDKFISSLKVPS